MDKTSVLDWVYCALHLPSPFPLANQSNLNSSLAIISYDLVKSMAVTGFRRSILNTENIDQPRYLTAILGLGLLLSRYRKVEAA